MILGDFFFRSTETLIKKETFSYLFSIQFQIYFSVTLSKKMRRFITFHLIFHFRLHHINSVINERRFPPPPTKTKENQRLNETSKRKLQHGGTKFSSSCAKFPYKWKKFFMFCVIIINTCDTHFEHCRTKAKRHQLVLGHVLHYFWSR